MDQGDIGVVDIRAMRIDRNPAESASFRVELTSGQIVNLHCSPHALSKLEAFVSLAVTTHLRTAQRHKPAAL
ncbi:hypothetical protein [Bosea sp. BK604]|uniref:hypothetical protein n=1 Tax=Bosea sp. BK604 TaxID=2512180 RepID=UPI0010489FC0|nr:hypothetical protein [Bosea sp. BK604]TCR63453.1 hypothetical protein EV560_108100 [Bosea sp. BK604]